jgi:hypothetical protein
MRESFPKTMHMLTMIMNVLQTMPYYFSDEIASKPYNHNWGNLLLIKIISNQINQKVLFKVGTFHNSTTSALFKPTCIIKLHKLNTAQQTCHAIQD